MLWVLGGIIAHEVAAKTVTSEVKVLQVIHCKAPPFQVVIEVGDRLLRIDILPVIVFGPTASSHTDHVYKYYAEVSTELFDDSEEECRGASITMYNYKFRFAIITTDNSPYVHWLSVVSAHANILRPKLILWYPGHKQHPHLRLVQICIN